MKRIILNLVIVSLLFFAHSTMASTVALLTPLNIDVVVGEEFDVEITVNAQSEENFTEKIEINFPAGLVEVKSFYFARKWMTLPSEDYDLIDNENGVLIKTGGYPGGFSRDVLFGTITFKSKTAGTGVIKLGSGSLAYDIDNHTKILGNKITFKIEEPLVISQQKEPETSKLTPEQNTSENIKNIVGDSEVVSGVVPLLNTAVSENITSESLFLEREEIINIIHEEIENTIGDFQLSKSNQASVAGIMGMGTVESYIILFLLLIIVVLIYFVYKFRPKNDYQNR